MPIISPCYPVCSAAPFVTKSTRQVIVQELERGKLKRILQVSLLFMHTLSARDIVEYTMGDTDTMLDLLFRQLVFFNRYYHFLQITITAETLKSKETWQVDISCVYDIV